MSTFSTQPTNVLNGFREVKPTKYASIPLGAYVRYFKDGELKYGGFLKVMRFPDYMVLFNYNKKVSWSVQLKDPSLCVWVRKKTTPATTKKTAPKKSKA